MTRPKSVPIIKLPPNTQANGGEGRDCTSIPAAIEDVFRRKPYGTRLRGLEALGNAFQTWKTKIVGCALDAEGERKAVRYYVRDDDDVMDEADSVPVQHLVSDSVRCTLTRLQCTENMFYGVQGARSRHGLM